jgi:hypothetical protein
MDASRWPGRAVRAASPTKARRQRRQAGRRQRNREIRQEDPAQLFRRQLRPPLQGACLAQPISSDN